MLSTLTAAFSNCRNRIYLALLVLVGVLAAYAFYTQQDSPRFSRLRERKLEPAVAKEFETGLRYDSTSRNTVLQPIAAAALPPQTPAGSLNPLTRKIVRNGSFSLTVKSYEPFFAELRTQANLRGGFVAQVEANRGAGSVSAAQIVLRMHPDNVDTFTAWLREQGTLTSEHLTSEDISEQYFDLSARLQNARRFEARLLEMLKTQTGKLQDLVLVEEKLNQIREQIEQFEGKVRLYDNLAGLATLTLSVRVEEHYVVSHPPTFGELVVSTWRNSTRALRESLQTLTLLCVAVTPWLPLLCVLGAVLWLFQRSLWSLMRKKQTI